MRSPKNVAAVLIASVLLSSVLVTPAFAASAPKTPAVPLAAAAPTGSAPSTGTVVKASAGGPLDIQVWPGQDDQTVVIAVVEVDATTKLPVTVRIPIVPGTTVQWAGEILGGDASADLERPFKLVDGQGGQFAEFQLITSRRGQVDTIGFPLKVEADMRSVSLDWVQSVASTLTAFSVRLPANISKASISPSPVGAPVNNPVGESLYTLEAKAYKPGEKQAISISYSTIPEVAPTPGSNLTPILIVLGIALAVAVVGLLVLVRRQNASVRAEGPTDDTAEGEASDPESDDSDGIAEDDDPFDDLDVP